MTDISVAEPIQNGATDAARKRVTTGRSPMYPFFDLERSVSRAKQLYDREKTHATPVMTALKHWGYTNASGKAGMTLSALKQFGLMEDLGRGDSRRVQLTTRAYDILNTPHESEREQLLREAALLPDIHQELWEEYGTALPSDSSLAWTLTKERGFTATGADDLIRQWKRTIEFAHLGRGPESVNEEVSEGDDSKPLGDMTLREVEQRTELRRPAGRAEGFVERVLSQPPSAVPSIPIQEYPIPIALTGRPPVVISGAFPLSEVEWAQFKAVLDAMKPVLVETAQTFSSDALVTTEQVEEL